MKEPANENSAERSNRKVAEPPEREETPGLYA
jgi:hypothetical protein